MPEMLTPSPVPQPQSGAVHRRMVRGFLLTMAIMAVVAVFVYRNIRELIEMHNWVAHTHEVLGVLQDTHAATNEVNASQRIYRLTGNVQDSAPYNLARMRATRNIERLRWLMKDNPVQLGNLAALEAEVLEQVTRASNAIARHEQQTLESSEIDSQRLKAVDLTKLREQIQSLENEEKRLLQERREDAESAAQTTLIASGCGLVCSVVILTAVFWLTRRERLRREQSESSLQYAKEQLESSLGELQRIGETTAIIATMGDFLQSCHTPQEAYSIMQRT